MLKLMKYEFIHSYRTFLIAFLIFLSGCVILPFVMDGFFGDSFVSIILGFGFSVLIIAIFFALFISIFVNYDRSMFKKPAYLTLTLPVSTTELIFSKILTTTLWLIIAMFVLFGGFMLMGFVISLKENTFSLMNIFELFHRLGSGFMDYIIHNPLDLFHNILILLGSLLVSIGTIYFSLTVVHTKWFRKHQFVYGIIIYIIMNLLIGFLSKFLFGIGYTINIGVSTYGSAFYAWGYVLYYFVLGGLFALGTIYIIDHHIEIE